MSLKGISCPGNSWPFPGLLQVLMKECSGLFNQLLFWLIHDFSLREVIFPHPSLPEKFLFFCLFSLLLIQRKTCFPAWLLYRLYHLPYLTWRRGGKLALGIYVFQLLSKIWSVSPIHFYHTRLINLGLVFSFRIHFHLPTCLITWLTFFSSNCLLLFFEI